MHHPRRRASAIVRIGLFAASSVLGVAGFASPAHAAWETRNAGGMSVHVYTPGGESPLGGHALLVALHGCTQSATQLRDFGNFEHAAEDFGMVVALPDVPGGGVYAGCWDYYGALHNGASGHDAAVISLAETLLADGTLGIDPAQVYVSGFSSGGGEALSSILGGDCMTQKSGVRRQITFRSRTTAGPGRSRLCDRSPPRAGRPCRKRRR